MQQAAFLVETDKEAIKECIKVGIQQKAVEYVEALCIGRTVSPRFGVAGAQYCWQCDSGNGTGSAPVVEHCVAEAGLANALEHQPFDFRSTQDFRQSVKLRSHRLLEVCFHLVR